MAIARTAWTSDSLTDLADGPAAIKELGDQVGNDIGAPAYTSTTRPTTGNYPGRLIYETDTGRVMRYPDSGSTWQRLTQSTWQSYTPSWTDGPSGSALSVGNGSLSGMFYQVGDTVHYQVRLSRGSTTNIGSTGWAFSLPVEPYTFVQSFGSGSIQRSGSGFPFNVVGVGGTAIVLVASAGSSTAFGSRVGTAVPGSWAAGDELFFGGTYRASTEV